MTYEKDFGTNEENNNQPQQSQQSENIPEQTDLSANEEPQRYMLKVMLVGSPKAIRSAIHYSHSTRQAEVGDWSPLQPCPNSPGEMMSMLIRKITVE